MKVVKDGDKGQYEPPKGWNNLADDYVVGNSDKMLFFTKELAASANDPRLAQNPFVMSKLSVDQVASFDFKPFMGYIGASPQLPPGEEASLPSNIMGQPITHRNFGKFYALIK